MRNFVSYLKFSFFANRSKLLLPLLIGPALYTASGLFELTSSTSPIGWGTVSFGLGLLIALQVTLRIFEPELNKETAAFYLGLPLAATERFLAKWVLSFALVFVGQFMLITLISGFFTLFTGGQDWLLGAQTLRKYLAGFFLGHSIFMAGGIFFQKSAFMKTMLAIFAYGFSSACVLAIFIDVRSNSGELLLQTTNSNSFVDWIGYLCWYALLPVGLYAAAFQRLREVEVRA